MSPAALPPAQGGSETILLVEDELSVRLLVAGILNKRGYTVHESASGTEALELFEHHGGKVDLLLTDMVMPGGVLGPELAARLKQQKPSLKVLYMTGYNPAIAGKDLDPAEAFNLLLKPFSSSELLRVVRQCLDGTRAPKPPV